MKALHNTWSKFNKTQRYAFNLHCNFSACMHNIHEVCNQLDTIRIERSSELWREILGMCIIQPFCFETFSISLHRFFSFSWVKIFSNDLDRKFSEHLGSNFFRTFRVENFSNILGKLYDDFQPEMSEKISIRSVRKIFYSKYFGPEVSERFSTQNVREIFDSECSNLFAPEY